MTSLARYGPGSSAANRRRVAAAATVFALATACVVAADLLGAAMMIPKTYRDPDSETLSTFAFASLGGALAAGAVGAADLSLLLYPAYFCLVNGAIAVLILTRRRALVERGRLGWVGLSGPG